MSEYHIPALTRELVELLEPEPGMVIVDATIGGGGQALAMLERIQGKGLLIGIDRDPEAISFCQARLSSFAPNLKLFNARFSQLDEVLAQSGIKEVDRVYFDLGVSWHQLSEPERGFSFLQDGPLDMRMNPHQGEPAWKILSRLEQRELEKIFREYGEERYSRRVARAIVRMREQGEELKRTRQLAELVEKVVPRGKQRVHPATRIFQAIRIYVNQELEELRLGLEKAFNFLKAGGRIAVISYHSLEDRLVKIFFKEREKAGELKILTKKPLSPSWEEKKQNPKSRSAKLRAGEKIK